MVRNRSCPAVSHWTDKQVETTSNVTQNQDEDSLKQLQKWISLECKCSKSIKVQWSKVKQGRKEKHTNEVDIYSPMMVLSNRYQMIYEIGTSTYTYNKYCIIRYSFSHEMQAT